MKKFLHLVLFSALLACGFNLKAQNATSPNVRVDRGENFTFVKVLDSYNYPYDISNNKKHIVIQGFGGVDGYYWSEETGCITLTGYPFAVSDEGVVAGCYSNDLGIGVAGLWSPTTKKWEFLGMNPDIPDFPTGEGEIDYNGAWTMNSNGKIGIMQFINGWNTVTYTWSKEEGYKKLSNGVSPGTRPNAISDDGRVLAGYAVHEDKGEWTPCYWIDGEIKRFPYLFGESLNVSHNGNYVCGYLLDNTGFVYNIADDSFVVIENTLEVDYQAKATCVSNDGIVFGYSDGGSPQDRKAIAYVGGELMYFNDYLVDLGIEEAKSWNIYSITDITADGKTFIGAADIDGEDCSFILNVEGLPCDAPTNLTYTIEDVNNIYLKWDAPENATDVTYEIYTHYSSAPFVNGITETSFLFDNMHAGEYQFFVRANYNNGECISGLSNVVRPIVYSCAENYKCELTFVKIDNGPYEENGEYFFGDGWNRGYISIKGSESNVEYKIQLDSKGSVDNPIIETLKLCPDTYQFTWVSGLWDEEVGFVILFEEEELYQVNFGDIDSTFKKKPMFFEYELACEPSENDTTNIVTTQEATFNIHTNPVNDRLYIETKEVVEEVVIYDVYGRQQKLSALCGQQSAIDVSKLNSGIYFVKINTKEGEIVKRFVKK